MNKGLIFGLGLLVGTAGGGLITNAILKEKYSQKADEEINACREAFLNELAKRRAEANMVEAAEKKEAAKEAMQKYGGDLDKAAPTEEPSKKTVKKAVKPPYEITENDYSDPANPFKAVGLTYFPQDGIVMREDGTFMERDDIEATIGLDALALFSDENEFRDRVIIRNEAFGCDYDITDPGMSYREWKDRYPE